MGFQEILDEGHFCKPLKISGRIFLYYTREEYASDIKVFLLWVFDLLWLEDNAVSSE